MDFISTKYVVPNMASEMFIPPTWYQGVNTSYPDIAPLLIVTWLLPTSTPSMFNNKTDGEGCQVAFYFRYTQQTLQEFATLYEAERTGTFSVGINNHYCHAYFLFLSVSVC